MFVGISDKNVGQSSRMKVRVKLALGDKKQNLDFRPVHLDKCSLGHIRGGLFLKFCSRMKIKPHLDSLKIFKKIHQNCLSSSKVND